MSDVAIIGSGPAGLFAALAVEHAGHTPHIYSKGDKSPMFGAMYLHEPLPGICDITAPDFEIDIMLVGNRDGYAYNVYGDRDAPCSWDHYESGYVSAWDLRKTYDALWDRYATKMWQLEVDQRALGSLVANFPLVLNSAPAPAFCRGEHEFDKKEIWIIHGDGSRFLLDGVNDGNMMYYNGVPWDGSFPVDDGDTKHDDGTGHGATFMRGHDWYRFSQINKYQAWEFSREPHVEEDNPRELSRGIKPLTNNCDCWSFWQNLRRIGRFGRWEKGVLTHHAYRDASEAVRALQ